MYDSFPSELLLATAKSYRLNSMWIYICNWPGPVTDFALKLLCFEHPQPAESCCCLPWEYDPVTQFLLGSKAAQKMERKKMKIQFQTQQVLPCTWKKSESAG